MKPNAYLEVDTQAIAHNTKLFKEALPSNPKVISVIKANGYGLGMVQLAHLQEATGMDMFGVLDIDQGIQLRKEGITIPILLLGAILEDNFNLLLEHDLIQVAISYEAAKRMSDYAMSLNTKIKVHLKVDSGLHRLGMNRFEDIKACYALEGLEILGMYSHFIESQNESDEGLSLTKKQVCFFNDILKQCEDHGFDTGLTHIQNSPSVLSLGDLGYGAVRCGMIMFGLFHPSQINKAVKLGYQSVMKFKTHIALIQNVEPGDTIGYGASYKVDKPMKIATLSTGYCDGIMKSLSLNGGGVIINDTWCPILGDIAMSHFMVDISNVDAKVEDIAIVFGDPLQDVYKTISLTKQSINEFISHLRENLVRIYI